MIDFNKVIKNKILIPHEDISKDAKAIVFFLNDDEIIYIWKTDKKVLEYVMDRSNNIKCTHYYTEFVSISDIDNILAELILTLQPIYNKKFPNENTKYITNEEARQSYHIDKREFKKYWKVHGELQFGKRLFLEKKIFDDIFSIPEPFSHNMPKIGTFINEIEDTQNRVLIYDQYNRDSREYESYQDKDGNWIEKTIHLTLSNEEEKEEAKLNYNNLEILIKHAYCVTNTISSKEFEAYSEYKKKKQIFNATERTWKKLPNQFIQNEILERYFGSLES